MNTYEILDFGNIEDLENKLRLANKQINILKKKNEKCNSELKSLNIRHIILKAQKKYNKVTTQTKLINDKHVTTTHVNNY